MLKFRYIRTGSVFQDGQNTKRTKIKRTVIHHGGHGSPIHLQTEEHPQNCKKKREREWFETGQPDYQRITNRLEVGIWWDGYIKKIYKANQTNVHKLGFVNMKSGAACVQ
jgi:hypothetical protein